MTRQNEKYGLDMCSGPLLRKVLEFSLPLMLTGVLQLLFNAADIIVVGQFAGQTALAAVGSTSSLINLIVNLFMGLSVGASVVVARSYGAGDHQSVSKALHTSVALSLISGILVGTAGFCLSRTLLEMMDSPFDVIDQAELYLKIYFIGVPASMIYNYCAAALRAIGDTRRPLIYLTISGVVNVVLNLVLVIFFDMGVAGVAIATVASQVVSMALILVCLVRSGGCIHLDFRKVRIHIAQLTDILKIGLPAGLQSSVFSVSNVLIQSSINSFGSAVIAANSAASNLEGFIYIVMNSVSQAALTFTGQNIGARRYDRIPRILGVCCGLVTAAGVLVGGAAYLLGPQLLNLYIDQSAKDLEKIISTGMLRLLFIAIPYFICGIMEVLAGIMRGCGYSMTPMIVSTLGACGFRILWIFTIFAANRTLETLYLSYPISWILTSLAHLICFAIVWRKMPHTAMPLQENA